MWSILPLNGLVQLKYNGLKNSLMGSEVWPMETCCKKCQSRTIRVTTGLYTQKYTHKLMHIQLVKTCTTNMQTHKYKQNQSV